MINGISFQSGQRAKTQGEKNIKNKMCLNTWASKPHSFSTTRFTVLHKFKRGTKTLEIAEVPVDINSHLKVRFIMVSLRMAIGRLVSWEQFLMGLMKLTSTRDNSLLLLLREQFRQQKGLGDRLIMIKTGTRDTLKTACFMGRELTGITNTGLSRLIGIKVRQ